MRKFGRLMSLTDRAISKAKEHGELRGEAINWADLKCRLVEY